MDISLQEFGVRVEQQSHVVRLGNDTLFIEAAMLGMFVQLLVHVLAVTVHGPDAGHRNRCVICLSVYTGNFLVARYSTPFPVLTFHLYVLVECGGPS